jgi:hypothetical protein
MKSFRREFEYRGYSIRKTSFNYRVIGDKLDEIVETYQDGKDLIDRTLSESNEKQRRKPNALDDELSNILK